MRPPNGSALPLVLEKPDGYWNDAEAIERELLEFVWDYGTQGRMPTQASLMKAGRADLTIAISRYGGGWSKVAKELGLELTQMPKDFWNDIENVKSSILALNERRGRPGEMPTKTDLDLAGNSVSVQRSRNSAGIQRSPRCSVFRLGQSHLGRDPGRN